LSELSLRRVCNAFWLPALSEDLTGFENLSGLGGSESEFSEWGGFHSANSKIREILIQTILDFNPRGANKQSLIRQLPTLRGLFQIYIGVLIKK